jgi:vanillate O-demethylase monooxygenase subunit
VKNEATTQRIFDQIQTAFLEDVAVFTAQQRSITQRPDAPQVDINADSGGIQARRIVDRLYQDEQATEASHGVAAE